MMGGAADQPAWNEMQQDPAGPSWGQTPPPLCPLPFVCRKALAS